MRYIKKFESICYYDADVIRPFISWFYDNFEDRMENEGWLIFYLDHYTIDNMKNYRPYHNIKGNFWQVQKNDDYDILEDDIEAEEYAKKCGLMLDSYGIVIGYDNVSFFEHPEELDVYKNIEKYNL